MVRKYQGNFFQTDSVSLPVNNVFRYYCIPHLGKPMLENLKENATNFSQIQHSSHTCTRYSWKIQSTDCTICCDVTRRDSHCVEFLSRISHVSFVEVLRNNFLGLIEERRGGIRAYHCRSGGFAYRGFPLLVLIRRLTVQPAPWMKKKKNCVV